MSESAPPPGWYPVSQFKQRYWDGASWTEHTASRGASAVPVQAPPAKSANTLTWVLLTIGLLLVLGVGGCIAFVSSLGQDTQHQLDDIRRDLSPTAP